MSKKTTNNTKTISINLTILESEELNDIVMEMHKINEEFDGSFDEPDCVLNDNADFIDLYDGDWTLMDSIEELEKISKENKAIYMFDDRASGWGNRYFFGGDLQKDILPIFKKRLEEMKKEMAEQEEQDRKWQEKSIEDELKAARKHLSELTKKKEDMKKGKRVKK